MHVALDSDRFLTTLNTISLGPHESKTRDVALPYLYCREVFGGFCGEASRPNSLRLVYNYGLRVSQSTSFPVIHTSLIRHETDTIEFLLIPLTVHVFQWAPGSLIRSYCLVWFWLSWNSSNSL